MKSIFSKIIDREIPAHIKYAFVEFVLIRNVPSKLALIKKASLKFAPLA